MWLACFHIKSHASWKEGRKGQTVVVKGSTPWCELCVCCCYNHSWLHAIHFSVTKKNLYRILLQTVTLRQWVLLWYVIFKTKLPIIRLIHVQCNNMVFDKYNAFSLSGWKADIKTCRGTMKVFSAQRNGCYSAFCCLFEVEVTGLYKIVNTEVDKNSWGFALKFGVDR